MFDRFWYGYVNFLMKLVKIGYDVGFFEVRSRLIGECWFFELFYYVIVDFIIYFKFG